MTQSKTGYLRGCKGMVIFPLLATGAPASPVVRYGIKTANKAGVELVYEEGEKSTLRGGDVIIAVVEDEDVVVGATFKFTDARFNAEATTIVAGGTLVTSGGDSIGWEAPKLSDQGTRLPFGAEVYVSNFTKNGILDGYQKITLPFCMGKAPGIEHADKEWATPEFEVKAKENPYSNSSCYRREFVTALPAELTS